jgi:hypothetical protein
LQYCPAEAISFEESRNIAWVLQELCFDCGLCMRGDICPAEAFTMPDSASKYPRVLSALFSDPNTTHQCTLVPGRGTQESKTNDVTDRISRGELGVLIEVGRPGLGCTFQDIQLMTMNLKKLNVYFEADNPLYSLMDHETGKYPEELISQRIMSAIIEIKISVEDLKKVMDTIIGVGSKIDTVFSLSVISRFDEDGNLSIIDNLKEMGLSVMPNAKINLGLGRPLAGD